jgi:CBS domain-containing protein
MTTIAAVLKHKGTEVVEVGPRVRIADVVEILSARRIGAVVVRDASAQLLGIVSERDIIHALAANGPRALEMTAGQLMTRALRTATPHTTITEAMTMMTTGRFRHLPVVDHGELVGIVSIGDVVKSRIDELEAEHAQLQSYITQG